MEGNRIAVSISLVITRWHPDTIPADREARRKYHLFTEAKETLEDDYNRLVYDWYVYFKEEDRLPKQNMTWRDFRSGYSLKFRYTPNPRCLRNVLVAALATCSIATMIYLFLHFMAMGYDSYESWREILLVDQ
jgi:curved DNA-binding protein CbpA